MNARQWKPGDVGIAMSGERFLVTRDGHCAWDSIRATDVVSGTPSGSDRPLVVIDPEDREQVERLEWLYVNAADKRNIADSLQAALRSMVAPPRPEEPTGLGAVVEDEHGRVLVRQCSRGKETDMAHPWLWIASRGDAMPAERLEFSYRDVNVVRVLSQGVES